MKQDLKGPVGAYTIILLIIHNYDIGKVLVSLSSLVLPLSKVYIFEWAKYHIKHMQALEEAGQEGLISLTKGKCCVSFKTFSPMVWFI